jgi:phosphoadenosine phosphosulfate reductase
LDDSVLETYAGLEGPELLDPIIRDFRGRVALVSSFGAESAVLLHMISRVDPAMPVIFLDTGKLFAETAAYRDRLVKFLKLTDVRTARSAAADLLLHDPEGALHLYNPDLCCHVRKTLPLDSVAAGFDVLISGRKRFHGGERARLEPLAVVDNRLKVEPLAHFSALDLAAYMAANDLPPHPLAARGYRSIGCMPCTTRSGTDDNPRAGRWEGREKTECGIHWTASGRLIRVTHPIAGVAAGGC